jgi:type II secretory pathway component PulF
MPVFEYVARDGSGTAVRGRAHAEDVRDLASLLRRQGLFLTSAESLALGSGGRVALSPGELANFTHHLAVLLDAGLTVFSALEALEEHAEEESLQRFSRVLREEVERGASLSQALASAAEGLPQGFVGVVQGGEVTGRLDVAFHRLSTYLERELEFRRRVREALTYPAVVLAAAFLVVGVFLTYVVPAFERVYRGAGAELPPLTRAVMAASRAARSLLLPLEAAVVPLVLVPGARRRVGRKVWAVLEPLVKLVRTARAARFLHSLGHSLASGVPVLAALPAAAGAAGKPGWSDALSARVERGGRLADALRALPGFPPVAVRLVGLGEESGQVADMALRAAEVLDREFELQVKRLLAALEPALTVALAAVVGVLLLALYMPIFGLGRAVLRH